MVIKCGGYGDSGLLNSIVHINFVCPENKLLREIFESKGDEVTDRGHVLHKSKLLYLYTAAFTIGIIKSTRLRFA